MKSASPNQPQEPTLNGEGSLRRTDVPCDYCGRVGQPVSGTHGGGWVAWRCENRAICDNAPHADSAAWWKAVAQGLARKLWPSREPPHPEDTCQVCGGPNVVWFAPNEVWNRVMPDEGGIVCPVCFVIAAEAKGICTSWRLAPEGTDSLAGAPVPELTSGAAATSRSLHNAADPALTPEKGNV